MEGGKPRKLLEIKCLVKGNFLFIYSLYRYANKYIYILGKNATITEAIEGCKYITKNGDGYTLKRKHVYFGQVQLGMAILNVKETDFVVFASKDNSFININVLFDKDFVIEMLQKLKFNYFTKMLHNVCVNKT